MLFKHSPQKTKANISGGKIQCHQKNALEIFLWFINFLRVQTENNIERPDDLVLKSVVNKSARKIHIIQNIDKKVSIEDIAKGQGLDYEELIEEVDSGGYTQY